MQLLSVSIVFASFIVIVSAITDLRSRIIPNALTYTGVISGLLIGFIPEYTPTGLSSFTGFAMAFIPSLLLFAMHSMGGGDVKLLAAVGALVGYPSILDVLFFSLLMGSAIGLSILIWRGQFLSTMRGMGWLVLSLIYPGMDRQLPATDIEMPFALAVALGTLWALYLPEFLLTKQLGL